MKRFTFSLLTFASVLSLYTARPVLAAALVQPIPISQAQDGGAAVSVWPGSGTNIDFTRTGEVIQKVWLDDPSALTVDFDGSLGDSGGFDDGGSQGAGASVIHLRRVTGISFPNLPRTASTLLSIVTQDSGGGHHLYQFQVNYGAGTPAYATVALMPDRSSSRAQTDGELVVGSSRMATLSDVERGLQQAISQNIITSSSPVVARTQDFLARVRNGDPLQSATDGAGVSMAVISQLALMGMSTGHSLLSDLLTGTVAPLLSPHTPAAPL